MSRNTVDVTFLKLDYWANIGCHFLFTLMPQTQGPWSRPAILFHLNLKFLNCILIRLCICHRARKISMSYTLANRKSMTHNVKNILLLHFTPFYTIFSHIQAKVGECWIIARTISRWNGLQALGLRAAMDAGVTYKILRLMLPTIFS